MSNKKSNTHLFFPIIPADLTLGVDPNSLKRYSKEQWIKIAKLAGVKVSNKLSSKKKLVIALRKHMEGNMTTKDLVKLMCNYNIKYEAEMKQTDLALAGISGGATGGDPVSKASGEAGKSGVAGKSGAASNPGEDEGEEEMEDDDIVSVPPPKKDELQIQFLLEKEEYNRKKIEMDNLRKAFEEEKRLFLKQKLSQQEQQEQQQQQIEKQLYLNYDNNNNNYQTPEIRQMFDSNGNLLAEFWLDENGIQHQKWHNESAKDVIINNNPHLNINASLADKDSMSNGNYDLNKNTGKTPLVIKTIKNSKRTELNRDNLNYVKDKVIGLTTKTKEHLNFVNGINNNVNGRIDNVEILLNEKLKDINLQFNEKNDLLLSENIELKNRLIKLEALSKKVVLNNKEIVSNLVINLNEDDSEPVEDEQKHIVEEQPLPNLENDNNNSDNEKEFTSFRDLAESLDNNNIDEFKQSSVYDKAEDFDIKDAKYNNKVIKVSIAKSHTWTRYRVSVAVIKLIKSKGISLNELDVKESGDYKIELMKFGKFKPFLAQVYFKETNAAFALVGKCIADTKNKNCIFSVHWWKNSYEMRDDWNRRNNRIQMQQNNNNWNGHYNNFNGNNAQGNGGDDGVLFQAARAANNLYNRGGYNNGGQDGNGASYQRYGNQGNNNYR